MGRIADQKKKEWEGFKIKTQFLIKDDKKESVNRKRQWLTHFFFFGILPSDLHKHSNFDFFYDFRVHKD